MVEVKSAGLLPNVPDEGGAYAVVCRLPGRTDRALGEIMLLGVAKDLRHRGAAILGTHAGLHAHQDAGGQADFLFVPLAEREMEEGLEAALVQEHMHRAGQRPVWNRGVPKAKPSASAVATADKILDALNVRPR